MNIHSTDKQLRDQLEHSKLAEVDFGSFCYGLEHKDSDRDVFIIYNDSDNMRRSAIKLFNNIQFKENNTDYVYCSLSAFIHDLLNGGNVVSFEVLHLLEGTKLDWLFQNRHMFYNYENARAFLGVARRDCRLYKENDKKLAHAYRSLEFAKDIATGCFELRFNDDRYDTLYQLRFGDRNDKLRKQISNDISTTRDNIGSSGLKRGITVAEYQLLDSFIYECMTNNNKVEYIDLVKFYEVYVAGGVDYS